MQTNKMLSPRDAAQAQGVALDWIYRQLWSGKFPNAKKVGKKWLIPANDLKGGR